MIRATRRLVARYAHINWALADQSMISGVNFLVGILLARYLGIDEFGRFTLAWMVILFASSIQHATINSPMMSIGPKQSESESTAYFGAVIFQQIAFSCGACFLLFAGVKLSGIAFPEWHLQGLALPLAAAALACQLQDFLRRYFFTRGRPSAAFANDAILYLGQIFVLICVFLAFRDSMDTTKVLWVIAVMAAVAVAGGMFLVERVELNAAVLCSTACRHWHFSKWLTASAFLQWFGGSAFIVVAGALLGASAVGAVKAAQTLMGVSHVLLLGLENVVPAQAARRFHEGGKKALYDYLKRVATLGGGFMLALASIAAIAPDFWLGLVFGDQYIGYGYLLQWFAVIYLLTFLGLPLRAGLRAIERTQTVFWAYVSMALFSLVAAYPFVSHLGLSGVGLGLLVMLLISVIVHVYGLRRRLAQL